MSVLKNIVFAIFSVILSLYVASLTESMKEMFFGVSDFIVGAPIWHGYPKRYDIFYAFTLIFSTVFFFLCMDKIYSYVEKIVSFSIVHNVENEEVYNSLQSIDYGHIFKVLKYPILFSIIPINRIVKVLYLCLVIVAFYKTPYHHHNMMMIVI